MGRDETEFKSRGKTYWRSWLLLVVIFLGVRILVLNNSTENLRFNVFVIYMLSLFILLCGLNFTFSNRSFYYLEDNHPEIFKQVYGGKYFTPVFNSFKIYKFMRSKDNYGDPKISIIKSNIISMYRLMLVSVITCPIMFLIYIY
jgi:hypothetical protein